MRQIKKILLLIIMLTIPVVIFLFLRFFGHNHFDIPVYYKSGIQKNGSCALENNNRQYFVTNLLVSEDMPTVSILFQPVKSADLYNMRNIINRLKDQFRDKLRIQVFHGQDSEIFNVSEHRIPNDSLGRLRDCYFFIGNDSTLVLTDEERKIRGYYTSDLEEIDRLIIETKILLESD